MPIKFKLKEPAIKSLYDNAVSGDFECIIKIADIYNKRNRFNKALEWYIYGAQKGHEECMRQVCLQVMSTHLLYPIVLRKRIILTALYWAKKHNEFCKTNLNEEKTEFSANLTTAIQKIVATYMFETSSGSMDFENVSVPSM